MIPSNGGNDHRGRAIKVSIAHGGGKVLTSIFLRSSHFAHVAAKAASSRI